MLYIYKFRYDSFSKKSSYESYTVSENIKETPKTYSLTDGSYFSDYRKTIKKTDLDILRSASYFGVNYLMVSEKPNEDLFKKLLVEKLNSSKTDLEEKISEIDSQLEYVNKL